MKSRRTCWCTDTYPDPRLSRKSLPDSTLIPTRDHQRGLAVTQCDGGALTNVTLMAPRGGHTSLSGVPSISMEVSSLPTICSRSSASRTVIVQVDPVRSP
jgi:hypothetical protein